MHARSIALLDHKEDDYFDGCLDLLDSLLLENGFASTEDRLLIKRTPNAEEALNHIKSFNRIFHSQHNVRSKNRIKVKQTPFFRWNSSKK